MTRSCLWLGSVRRASNWSVIFKYRRYSNEPNVSLYNAHDSKDVEGTDRLLKVSRGWFMKLIKHTQRRDVMTRCSRDKTVAGKACGNIHNQSEITSALIKKCKANQSQMPTSHTTTAPESCFSSDLISHETVCLTAFFQCTAQIKVTVNTS